MLIAVVELQVGIAPSEGSSISSASEIASISPVSFSVGLQPIFPGSIIILAMSGIHSVWFQLLSSSGMLSHMCWIVPVEFLVCVGGSFLLPSRLMHGESGLLSMAFRIDLSGVLDQLSQCLCPHSA